MIRTGARLVLNLSMTSIAVHQHLIVNMDVGQPCIVSKMSCSSTAPNAAPTSFTCFQKLPRLEELHLYNLHPGFEHKQLPSYRNDGFDIGFVDFDESRVPGNPQEQLKELRAFSDQVKSLYRRLGPHIEARQRAQDKWATTVTAEKALKHNKNNPIPARVPHRDIKLMQLMANGRPKPSEN